MGFSFGKLFSQLHAEEEVRILMVGLDDAGKTTILCYLDLGEIVTTTPVVDSTFVETLLKNTRGLVFVVDSNDCNQIAEARNELHQMLHENELRDNALLIFANKADLPSALTSAEISDKLGLFSLAQRQWYITSTCAKSGEGLYEGFQWLCKTGEFFQKNSMSQTANSEMKAQGRIRSILKERSRKYENRTPRIFTTREN